MGSVPERQPAATPCGHSLRPGWSECCVLCARCTASTRVRARGQTAGARVGFRRASPPALGKGQQPCFHTADKGPEGPSAQHPRKAVPVRILQNSDSFTYWQAQRPAPTSLFLSEGSRSPGGVRQEARGGEGLPVPPKGNKTKAAWTAETDLRNRPRGCDTHTLPSPWGRHTPTRTHTHICTLPHSYTHLHIVYSHVHSHTLLFPLTSSYTATHAHSHSCSHMCGKQEQEAMARPPKLLTPECRSPFWPG